MMRAENRNHFPDWSLIISNLFHEKQEQTRVAEELAVFAIRLKTIPKFAKDIGVPSDIVERAMTRSEEIAEAVLASCSKI